MGSIKYIKTIVNLLIYLICYNLYTYAELELEFLLYVLYYFY